MTTGNEGRVRKREPGEVRVRQREPGGAGYGGASTRFVATVYDPTTERTTFAYGPTEAAAREALARKLREAKS